MTSARVQLRLLLLAAILSGIACARRPAAIRPIGPDSVVLAFGDSLTAGTGSEGGRAYPDVLGELLGCRVVNGGVSGEVTAQGVERLPALLEQHRPSLVIVCHGGNDLLQKEDEAAIAERLRRMVRAALESGADVIVVAVPQPGLTLSPHPLYRKVAREAGVPVDDTALRTILGQAALKSDYVHPNAAGYRAMADALAHFIRESAR